MQKFYLFFFFLILVSCEKAPKKINNNDLNGYWEISKVVDENGIKKEFQINENYDYFSIKGDSGIHKKVRWQPDGTFLVNDLQDKLKIVLKDKETFVKFHSKYGNHSNKIESLTKQELVLIANHQLAYHYKKVVLNKDKYGKTNQ